MDEPSDEHLWPFDQAPHVAAITLRRIIFDGGPILRVSHDEDDDGWQFLDGKPMTTADAAVVGMGTVVRYDPTVREVADLPPGWVAVRDRVSGPWRRSRQTAR